MTCCKIVTNLNEFERHDMCSKGETKQSHGGCEKPTKFGEMLNSE